jgi:nucleotide-binding universal stress UspA family protein
MYKHILVPTDGTKLSSRAIRAACALAQTCGAKITGVYVVPPYLPPIYAEGMIYVADLGPQRHRDLMAKAAKRALAVVTTEAQLAGVACATASPLAAQPWEGILKTARAKRCDLIVMASHGRRGIAGLLLGSETTKVLTHSKTPVLVCR